MPASDDVPELMDRLRAGEPGAADALARAVRPEVARLARARLRDASLADDVTQEAHLEVLATFDALRDPRALRAWLRLVVRKHADRATRRVRPTVPLDMSAVAPDPADGPDVVAQRLGDVAMIRLALTVLRDEDALLLRLRYLGEWTDAELAELVGAAPGTVRKRLFDARRRLRAVVEAPPSDGTTTPSPHREEQRMTTFDPLIGRIVEPGDIPPDTAPTLTASGRRLETGLKVLDAVVPLELGGTVDVLGPAGLGQLVLVGEIAAQSDAVLVAGGRDEQFRGLLDDGVLRDRALVVAGDDAAGVATAAARAANGLAADGRTVLLVLDEPAWAAATPVTGEVEGGPGSVTAFRFAPHPRDGEPRPALEDAGTTLVYATQPFIEGLHPAIDVVRSRSTLIDRGVLDGVTTGAAKAARDALTRAASVRTFLAQPLLVSAAYTGVPGEHVPAHRATEGLAELVR